MSVSKGAVTMKLVEFMKKRGIPASQMAAISQEQLFSMLTVEEQHELTHLVHPEAAREISSGTGKQRIGNASYLPIAYEFKPSRARKSTDRIQGALARGEIPPQKDVVRLSFWCMVDRFMQAIGEYAPIPKLLLQMAKPGETTPQYRLCTLQALEQLCIHELAWKAIYQSGIGIQVIDVFLLAIADKDGATRYCGWKGLNTCLFQLGKVDPQGREKYRLEPFLKAIAQLPGAKPTLLAHPMDTEGSIANFPYHEATPILTFLSPYAISGWFQKYGVFPKLRQLESSLNTAECRKCGDLPVLKRDLAQLLAGDEVSRPKDYSFSTSLASALLKCTVCGKADSIAAPLLLCGSCKIVRYCSKQCQLQDWKAGHKTFCGRKK